MEGEKKTWHPLTPPSLVGEADVSRQHPQVALTSRTKCCFTIHISLCSALSVRIRYVLEVLYHSTIAPSRPIDMWVA